MFKPRFELNPLATEPSQQATSKVIFNIVKSRPAFKQYSVKLTLGGMEYYIYLNYKDKTAADIEIGSCKIWSAQIE